MKYCTNCGTSLPDTSVFCYHCGDAFSGNVIDASNDKSSFKDIFFHPSVFFEHTPLFAKWQLSILILTITVLLIIGVGIVATLLVPLIGPSILQFFSELNVSIPYDEFEKSLNQYVFPLKSVWLIKIFIQIIATWIFSIAGIFFYGAVYYLLMKMFGGVGEYIKIVQMVPFTRLPRAVFSVFYMIIIPPAFYLLSVSSKIMPVVITIGIVFSFMGLLQFIWEKILMFWMFVKYCKVSSGKSISIIVILIILKIILFIIILTAIFSFAYIIGRMVPQLPLTH